MSVRVNARTVSVAGGVQRTNDTSHDATDSATGTVMSTGGVTGATAHMRADGSGYVHVERQGRTILTVTWEGEGSGQLAAAATLDHAVTLRRL